MNWGEKKHPHDGLVNFTEQLEQTLKVNVDKFKEENSNHANIKC